MHWCRDDIKNSSSTPFLLICSHLSYSGISEKLKYNVDCWYPLKKRCLEGSPDQARVSCEMYMAKFEEIWTSQFISREWLRPEGVHCVDIRDWNMGNESWEKEANRSFEKSRKLWTEIISVPRSYHIMSRDHIMPRTDPGLWHQIHSSSYNHNWCQIKSNQIKFITRIIQSEQTQIHRKCYLPCIFNVLLEFIQSFDELSGRFIRFADLLQKCSGGAVFE